mgnify:CR=1 FL=1
MTHAMHHYQVLSRLLLYPEPELIAHLPQLEAGLAAVPEQHALLRPLLAHLESSSLIDLQQHQTQVQFAARFVAHPAPFGMDGDAHEIPHVGAVGHQGHRRNGGSAGGGQQFDGGRTDYKRRFYYTNRKITQRALRLFRRHHCW